MSKQKGLCWPGCDRKLVDNDGGPPGGEVAASVKRWFPLAYLRPSRLDGVWKLWLRELTFGCWPGTKCPRHLSCSEPLRGGRSS